MTKEVMVPQTFEDKMKERIRDSIGELITDEELSKLVHKSVDQVFFQPVKLKDGFHYKEGPSLLNGLIGELLTGQVREAVNQYIKEHPDEVIKAVKEVLSSGMGNAVLSALNAQFQSQLWNLQQNIENTIINR